MTHTVTITEKRQVPVRYLQAKCGARYWEDATVNGETDDDGSRIPCRDGEYWMPLIDLDSGRIVGWPQGTTADVHYKVCDDGVYTLVDEGGNAVTTIDGYVPAMMCPADNGYGDYVIMKIDGDGKIADWVVNLEAFEKGDEE